MSCSKTPVLRSCIPAAVRKVNKFLEFLQEEAKYRHFTSRLLNHFSEEPRQDRSKTKNFSYKKTAWKYSRWFINVNRVISLQIHSYKFVSNIKGLLGSWNIDKSICFIIFYIIVHVKNIFPKFQVNHSKILEERDFVNPLLFGSLWIDFCSKRVFLKTVFLKSVDTISQKLRHRSC